MGSGEIDIVAVVSALEALTALCSQMECLQVANTQVQRQSSASTQKPLVSLPNTTCARPATHLTSDSTHWLCLSFFFK